MAALFVTVTFIPLVAPFVLVTYHPTESLKVTLERDVQLLKAQFRMLVTPPPTVTLLSERQESKALYPILVTLSGTVILVRDTQPVKKSFPILVIPLGKVIFTSEVH